MAAAMSTAEETVGDRGRDDPPTGSRGARRIPGGTIGAERNVARHAPGTRAADPRDPDALAAGSLDSRGDRRSAARGAPGADDTPTRNGHLIGYARVSTHAQDLALQLDGLRDAGCERIYQDVGSGSIRARPQLDACLDHVLPGDTLVVWRLDRLGRSLRHLIEVIAGLQEREVAFRSLRECIDTTTAAGRLQLHLFAALAEFERELIRERSAAGRDAARARGRQGGRARVITPELLAAATAMRDKRELTMSQIHRALNVGRSTLYKHPELGHETSV
jgi:DNA invertase Pin-like site-specific DNA recombinase